MQKYIITLFLLVVSTVSVLNGQPVPVTINFDTAVTNSVKSKSVFIKNPSDKIIRINSVRTVHPDFYVDSFTPFSINPFDSVSVTINFKTKHNVTFRGFIIFENSGLKYSIVYYLTATGKYSETIYAFSQGLWDEQLKTAIRTYTSTGYVSLGYNTARDHMFATIDKYLTNDTIECVYTGTKIRALNRDEAQNQGFNTEHTYPQSLFSSNEPMQSDLYHLFPTLDAPNSCRSNYKFNKVFTITSPGCNVGGSKLGTDSTGEIVYEPRDKHKGNVARSMFYFCIKYNTVTPGGFMNAKQEARLKLWNNSDTVDANERLRNTRIAAFQHVRNPFIDHPELIERIQSTYSTIPARTGSKVTCSPYNVIFDTVKSNDTTSYYVTIMNYGYSTYNITSVVSSLTQFTVESFTQSIPVNSAGFIKIKFRPTAINQTYNAALQINGLDTNLSVNLKGFSNSQTGVTLVNSNIPDGNRLYQNYPNPFNPSTQIRFDVKEKSSVKIELFDLSGKQVDKVTEGIYEAGSYSTVLNAGDYSSGIYFVSLQMFINNNDPIFRQTVKILFLK